MSEQPWYRLSLADVQLLASAVADLDGLKNLAPEGPDRQQTASLVDRAHTTLHRILGDDLALIYAPEDKEQAA